MTTDLTPANQESEKHPWERLKGESARSYAAFCQYRDMLDQRSLTKVAQIIHEGLTSKRKPQVDSIRSQLGEWSSKHRWVERADAYLDHLDDRWRESRESEIDEANRRTRQAGALLTTLGLRRFHGGEVETSEGTVRVAPLDLNNADISDAIRLVDVGLKYTRLGTGLPTEMVGGKVMITVRDYTKAIDYLIQECALPLIPEELHERFWRKVETYSG